LYETEKYVCHRETSEMGIRAICKLEPTVIFVEQYNSRLTEVQLD
jgi:hypothetical protein